MYLNSGLWCTVKKILIIILKGELKAEYFKNGKLFGITETVVNKLLVIKTKEYWFIQILMEQHYILIRSMVMLI